MVVTASSAIAHTRGITAEVKAECEVRTKVSPFDTGLQVSGCGMDETYAFLERVSYPCTVRWYWP